MARYFLDNHEEEMKSFIRKMSAICVSVEFATLRRELELLYLSGRVENAAVTAFQDALYALLTESEGDTQALSARA